MRILLSAYACEPGVGSEPGIGWRWAIELARLGHDVIVVTRSTKQKQIEKGLNEVQYSNLKFVFYELPVMFVWPTWHRLWPFTVGHRIYWHVWEHVYHFAWQYGAYRTMRWMHSRTPFDIVHHITLGTARRATFMGRLDGSRLVFGPLGGGERSPRKLRSLLTWSARVVELARDVSIIAAKFNPFLWASYKAAHIISLKTNESVFLVPKRFRNKVRVQLEIGTDTFTVSDLASESHDASNAAFKVLFVGRFLYWKGMAYGIRAFAKLVDSNPAVRLTMIGKGPEEQRWRRLARSLSIEEYVEWVSWVARDQLEEYYRNCDVFLFPSLHDSSGNVVLESISNALPVICFDLGGPATIVDDECSRICPTKGKDAVSAIEALYTSMKELSEDRGLLNDMKTAARVCSEKFGWSKIVAEFYNNVVVPTESDC